MSAQRAGAQLLCCLVALTGIPRVLGAQNCTVGLPPGSEVKITEGDGDYFGFQVSSAGDINNDGFDDLVVGAPAYPIQPTRTGSAYLYLGNANGTLSNPQFLEPSNTYSKKEFGNAVSAAGDIDSDGFGDVIFGSRWDSSQGSAFLYRGGADGTLTFQQKIVALDAGDSDQFGEAVSAAGDVNGDTYDDCMVSAIKDDDEGSDSGSVYLLLGGDSGSLSQSLSHKFSAPDGTSSTSAQFGKSLAPAGDMNKDSYGDVLVGAPYDDEGGNDAGAVYLFLGSSSGTVTFQQKLMAPDAAPGDEFGFSISTVDVDGNGVLDAIVGAPKAFSVYLFLGSANGTFAYKQKLHMPGSDEFGYSVTSAQDVNFDSFGDIVVGAYYDDELHANAGAAFLFLGNATGQLTFHQKWFASDGSASTQFGWSVSTIGDFDGDGRSDVVIAAPRDNPHGTDSLTGSAYVYFGSDCPVVCPPGFALGQSGCEACGVGYFTNETNPSNCSSCPAYMTTISEGAFTIFNCTCLPGYTVGNGPLDCVPCSPGTYKEGTGASPCTSCPGRSSSSIEGSATVDQCSCDSSQGYARVETAGGSLDCACERGWMSFDSQSCEPCESGSYKETVGFHACRKCPSGNSSLPASVSLENCNLTCGSVLPLDTVFEVGVHSSSTFAHIWKAILGKLKIKTLGDSIKQVLMDACVIEKNDNPEVLCWNSGTTGTPQRLCINSYQPDCS